jgi:heme-degrading monooxygenase HmoA
VISRQWRGLARAEFADAYVDHLRSDTFPAIRKIPGFSSASILRRDLPTGVEFLIVTNWASIEAVRAFAGSSPENAVVPQKVRDMMIEFDPVVQHYEVVN